MTIDESARMKILEMIEAGTISAEEGLRLLQALTEVSQDEATPQRSENRNNLRDKPFLVIEPSSKSKIEASPLNETLSSEAPPADNGEVEFTPQESLDEPLKDAEPFAESESPEGEVPADETAFSENVSSASEGGAFQPLPADVEKWQRWWMIPLWVGVGVTILAGLWMYSAFMGGGFSFWFLCAWVPLLLGVGLMALSYSSRRSRWLHLRIDQKPGEKPQHIAISMPLPLGLVSWFFKYFGHYVPNIPGDIQVEQILQAVTESTSPENPLYVEVDEGENGEKVKVYIG